MFRVYNPQLVQASQNKNKSPCCFKSSERGLETAK